MTEEEISQKDFEIWARNYKLFERYKMLNQQKSNFRTNLHVLIGDSGAGMSLTARMTHCIPGTARTVVGGFIRRGGFIVIDQYQINKPTIKI